VREEISPLNVKIEETRMKEKERKGKKRKEKERNNWKMKI
jgi:hypothetical protein